MMIAARFRTLLSSLVFIALLLGAATRAEAGNVDLPRFPSVSPDGSQIVFSWRGDLWKVSAQGGHAVRMTSHTADELHSAWSPCGTRIAFNSTRDGYANIYLMNADGTNVQQVTNIDRACIITGWGVDENGAEVITFEAQLEGDVYRSLRPYMVSPQGGDLRRIHHAFGSQPAINHDGSKVAFTRGGYYYGWQRRHYRGSESMQVWLYDRATDTFTQLTHRRGNDGNARWAGRDGTLIYLSDREMDTVNLYRMNASRGDAASTRLTSFNGRDVQDFDVSADGRTVVFNVWDTLYVLNLTAAGAQPRALTITANEDDRDNYEVRSVNRDVSEAALSPDGQVMAYITYGGVYVRNITDKSPTRAVTTNNGAARHRDLAWSPDGLKLYFTSDQDGTDSIYAATVTMTRSEVRENFESALKKKEEAPAEAKEDNAENGDTPPTPPTPDTPDAPTAEDKPAPRGGARREEKLPKELDPKRWHDAVTFAIAPVVQTTHNDRMTSPSPDGKSLAFKRGQGDLMIFNLATREERQLVPGWDMSIHWRWSPDSKHIAYSQNDLNFTSDIRIIAADGSSPPVNITRHPYNDQQPRWSADGRVLSFISNRIGREYDVWMVYLDRNLESLTALELEKYYEEAVKEARKLKPLPTRPDKPKPAERSNKSEDDSGEKKDEDKPDEAKPDILKQPIELHLDDAYLRLRRVTTLSGSETGLEMTPAGDRYIFLATGGGPPPSRGLYSIKWDGSDLKRISSSVNVQHLTLTGDRVVFVSGGRAGTTPASGGSDTYYDISHTVRLDLQAQAEQKFREAARVLGESFYHHNMTGLDWDALTLEYLALARQTRTASEFNHVGNRFLGELNRSHLGIRAGDPPSPNRQASGRLGTRHERVVLNDGRHGFRVLEIIPKGPAALGSAPKGMELQLGDIITAIELEPFSPTDTVESRLQGMIGREVILTIQRAGTNGDPVEVNTLITPTSYGAENQLRYEAWCERNRQLVAEWSRGRLGYIHIQGMNQASLEVYERDLYAAAGDKQGLLIDVRNNGGGSTADRILASIMVQPHAYTIPRGAPLDAVGYYPQDRLFIQRYTLPINMLCNEKSFSNAEIISHAFKTLGRGTLVGQETYGGVISTGGFSLIDGTTVRMPFRGWYLPDGTDMEDTGAVPDIIVNQTPEAEVRDDDEQLRAAVEDLLKRLE